MTNTNQRIASAWNMHREGRNQDAITEFKRILLDVPDIMGLAWRIMR
jgi:hypothetical protein